MVELEVRLSSRQRVYVPNVQAFDKDSGEAVDPVLAGLTPLFALVPAGAPDPPDTAYVDGVWTPNKVTPTANVVVGKDAPLPVTESGAYDLWMGVNGIAEAPRDIVARIVVP